MKIVNKRVRVIVQMSGLVFFWKQNCALFKFLYRKMYILLNTTLSRTLVLLHNRLIGRYSSTSDSSQSLTIGLTSHIFYSSGHLLLIIKICIISINADIQGWFFNTMLPMSSGTVVFVTSRKMRTDLTSFLGDFKIIKLSIINLWVCTQLVTLTEGTCKELAEHFTFLSIICSLSNYYCTIFGRICGFWMLLEN